VINIAWNPTAQKLTTSDENGLIIVWMLHRGLWFEEMINNRNKSFVKDLQWNAEGKFICIAYADGAVIVGSVAGSREWGKTLQHNLERVQWSPDSKYILFATAEGTLEVYNSRGDHLTGVELQPEDTAGGGGGAMLTGTSGSASAAASAAAAGGSAGGGSAVGGGVSIVALDWYNGLEGFEDPSLPTLAIGFENGRLQLMCGHDDASPMLVDTGMKLTTAKWNPQGTVLAVAGMNTSGGGSGTPYVQFYDSRGRHLRNLKLPGSGVRRLTWEGTGLRLAMAVDSFIFFANVRPPYKWASLGGGLEAAETAGALAGGSSSSAAAAAASASASSVPLTVVYAFTRPDRSDGGQALVFWNTANGEKSIQLVPGVEAIQGAGDRALVVLRTTDGDEAAASGGLASGLGVASRGAGRFAAYVFDSAGKPLHSKFLDVDPAFTAMTQQHVIIASDEQVVVWQYRSRVRRMAGVSVAAGLRQVQGKVRTFHIDDDLAVDGRRAEPGSASGSGSGLAVGAATTDPITCVAASAKILLVGRASGMVMRYTLPHLVNDAKYMLRGRPAQIAINCTSTVFGVIDWRANLSFFDMSARDRDATTGKEVEGKQLARDRKDTWAVQWAVDSPTVCAAMEKTKLLVIDDLEMEKPPAQVNSGFIAYVDTTCVRCVMMDEVVAARDEPSSAAIVEFETAALRKVTALIAGRPADEDAEEAADGAADSSSAESKESKAGDSQVSKAVPADGAGSLDAAVDYVKDHPHPRLWRLVADAAMQRLDFVTAERALAACSDYAGIQMVKRLRRLPDADKQRAEVAAFFRRFGEAEQIYLDADRPDLAVDMRARLGDWHRVLYLLDSPDPTADRAGGSGLAGQEDEAAEAVPGGVARGIAGRDRMAAQAHERLGEALAEVHEWATAVPHFVLAKSSARLADCLFRVEDYDGLVRLAKGLTTGDPLLPNLADKLQAAGLTKQAAEAWVAAGDPKAAIDCCVLQNEWATAVELAEEHGYPQIEGLFGRYAEHLLGTGDAIAAVELYRKAKKETEAAKLLARLGEEALGAADDPEAAAAASTAAATAAGSSGEAAAAAAGGATAVASARAMRMTALTGAAVTLSASADPARAKKLFVLAALEVERFKQRTLDLKTISAATLTGGSSKTAGSAATAATLNTLLAQDAATATATRAGTTTTRESKRVARTLDQAWRAAEAVHFWMLAQDQLHSRRAAEAMQSAMRATLFEDVLPSRATYSLLALSAIMAGYMGVASRAFIRLESLPEEEADEAARDAFKGLAYTIYSSARPVDRATAKVACPKCSAGLSPWSPLCMACGETFEGCVATGEPIRTQPYYRCGQCRHKMLLEVAAGRKSCALCHFAVSDEQIQQRRHHAGSSSAAGTAAGMAQAGQAYGSEFPI
jgi:WD repeat-containing protein 35